ncbi:hypothetical protein PPL_04660 [Heterostelium album PN500]|uniref:Uncharacterized protein n=1 Tax=Heterostelium pallidum (strain ATCC 26659 / Pp 5 / PN500) TaxID=670386 RepID=D3B869_HETP5|nr:hypothetical protein PPL_04660 [Heterostelium album PN500]EFA82237.1 hypothetical protein PPL_04660 [Heterostelium album PN500]|eukprot:XP_020434354.1 hypothetical protein PPL_04660 [Heterostelium album PN500]
MIVFSEDDDKFLDQYHRCAYTPPTISNTNHNVNVDLASSESKRDIVPLSIYDQDDNDDSNNNNNNIDIIDITNMNGSTRKNSKSNGSSSNSSGNNNSTSTTSPSKKINIPKTKKRSQSSASKFNTFNNNNNNNNSNSNNNNNNISNIENNNLNDIIKKNKQRDWFESESSHDDHNQITVLISPIRNYYQPGDTLDVVVNVNVKRLQCLNATFEGYSSCQVPPRHGQEDKTPNLLKSKIAATNFYLYPTEDDIPLNLSSKSINNNTYRSNSYNNIINVNNQMSTSTSTTSTSTTTTTTTSTTTTAQSISNPSSTTSSPFSLDKQQHQQQQQQPLDQQSNNTISSSTANLSTIDKELLRNVSDDMIISNLGKSTSFSSLYISDLVDDEWFDMDQQALSQRDNLSMNVSSEELQDLEDIDSSLVEPPQVQACADHLVLSKKKHKFTFQLKIPQSLPPSFAFSKQSKNGIFYRIHLSGLGQMHHKFNRTEHSLIKGFETSIPLSIWNPKCDYLPRQLLQADNLFCSSETYQSTKNNVHIKARLLIKNFCVIDSAVSTYQQTNQHIKRKEKQRI